MNPTAAKLYRLFEIQKDQVPIRPIVSYSNSPLAKLANNLNLIFKKYNNFKSQHSINDLTEKLKNSTLPQNT